MIRDVSIENYKSISELSLELGQVNLLIGANGSGKSNILEAIIFGSAAAAEKFDNEFLANRGIRISNPGILYCGFDKANREREIALEFSSEDGNRYKVCLTGLDGEFYGWEPLSLADIFESEGLDMESLRRILEVKQQPRIGRKEILKLLQPSSGSARRFLSQFLTYTPEISTLRQLHIESYIQPLGLHGEGLFRLLHSLDKEGQLDEVNEALTAIDWFDGLKLAGNGAPTERTIRIVDQYLDPEIATLDQRSVNEGFLFFLFHVTLLISRHTPPFFAIENVDESLNPKLCVHLIQTIARLSERHEKQVILTTHNPATLDGLDLSDDEQRLFVVFRNADGHTRVRRILASDIAAPEGTTPRLSEAFIRGYIGGLPTNF